MKKVILGSFVLLFAAISIGIFQISCQKEAIAQTGNTYTLPAATTSTLGGIIVGNGLSVTSNGTLSTTSYSGITQYNKILIALKLGGILKFQLISYDGTSITTIDIPALPSGCSAYSATPPALSPDGKKIFFYVIKSGNLNYVSVYSINVDGTGLLKVYENANSDYNGFALGGAY